MLARNLEQIQFSDFYRNLPWPLPSAADLENLHDDDHWVAALKPALLRVNDTIDTELFISLASILREDGTESGNEVSA